MAQANEMNEFDRFLKKNCDLLAHLSPLTKEEREVMSARSQERQRNPFEHMSDYDREIYIAKKNKICPAFAASRYATAKFNSKEYGKKILGREYKAPFMQKPKDQLMDYKKASKLFWEVYLKDSIQPTTFIIDENNKMAISNLLKYFIVDPTCVFDLNKGICLAGGVGTGKTNIMQQLAYFCEDNELSTGFKIQSMRGVAKEVARSGIDATTKYMTEDICFDDIAVGSQTINTYGTLINPLDDLIQGRYDRFVKRNSRPTHFTTNLDFNPNDQENSSILEMMYDKRSIDRIKQMCNFVYLGGKSRRI